MARELSRAEAWERAHEIFTQVNFNAFDYNSIKESLLDYVKLYFPEDFNDYIESSEFIAILELFAYVGELLAYRVDMNAHENFITTAQRKESILRLAKLISYKASRNIPARGLVKITSVQTTENVIDSNGRNLAGRRVYWNDLNNSDWKEQFILILNKIFEQDYGSITPNERTQVGDILYELYTLNNMAFGIGNSATLSYTVNSNGDTFPMEIVPVELNTSGPKEKRPEQNAKFSLLYANDGLGDNSDTTGFMMFTKQGTLSQQIISFDGVTPNITHDINTNNINETDVWINNINTSGSVVTENPYADLLPHLSYDELRFGEWVEVDLANAQNIIFNTNKNRHKYEIETLDNDQIRLIFGDGEFSDIPSGLFQIWFRTSANSDVVIDKANITNQNASFSYTDSNNSIQTLTLTFSLTSSLQNASASEDIEHIRRVAPSVYYTQDRMVNGRDYNVFMMQDPSILKLRAINRTFAGDSKYLSWHDPKEYYENVKIFGEDLALYWKEQTPDSGNLQTLPIGTSVGAIIQNYLTPWLSSLDFFSKVAPIREQLGLVGGNIRTYFSSDTYSFGLNFAGQSNELDAITYALNNLNSYVDLYYSVPYDEWTIGVHPTSSSDSIWLVRIDQSASEWELSWLTRHQIIQSSSTKFWNTNTTEQTIDYDTLSSLPDTISILKANENSLGTGILDSNKQYSVVAQEMTSLNNGNYPDEHRLSVIPVDTNGDNIPDDISQSSLINLSVSGTWAELEDQGICVGTYPNQYIDLTQLGSGRKINNNQHKGLDLDIQIQINNTNHTFADSELIVHSSETNSLILTKVGLAANIQDTDDITIIVTDYVYFTRSDVTSDFEPQVITDNLRIQYMAEDYSLTSSERLYERFNGRYPLNFAWFHYTPRMNLVDPATSNIIDMFIITKGYYTSITQWLLNYSSVEPIEPQPRELRSAYADLLDNKMISDNVVLHSGQFKILFGSRAIPQLRAIFKVIRPSITNKTDNQIKTEIVNIVRAFFSINQWEFGETFFFTELASSIHAALGPEIDSVVLVPTYTQNLFGDLFQISSRENELFIPDIDTTNIEIVNSFSSSTLKQLTV